MNFGALMNSIDESYLARTNVTALYRSGVAYCPNCKEPTMVRQTCFNAHICEHCEWDGSSLECIFIYPKERADELIEEFIKK